MTTEAKSKLLKLAEQVPFSFSELYNAYDILKNVDDVVKACELSMESHISLLDACYTSKEANYERSN